MSTGAQALYRPPAGSITPYIANHGPGAAYRLRVRYAAGLTARPHFAAYERWPLFSETYKDYDLREDSVPLAVGACRQLRVFDEIKSAGLPLDFDDTGPEILTQVVVECRCLDAEDHPGKSGYIGLKRSMPVETSPALGLNAMPVPHNYNMWTVMESADVEFLLLNLALSMRWGVPRPLKFGHKPVKRAGSAPVGRTR
jgi:hypothetical protein